MGRNAISWLEASRLPARLIDLAGNVHRVAGWPERSADSDRFPNDL
jgi:hypothetical protein